MEWLSYEEARAIACTLGLKNQTEWGALSTAGRLAPGLPSNPREKYRREWLGWAYWLGTGPAKESSRPKWRVEFLPFEQAREFARLLGFKNQTRWTAWAKTSARPSNIPSDPRAAYKGKGWEGWPDWLGYEPARATGRERVRPFPEAREFARALRLEGYRAWTAYADSPDRPADIPKSPDCRYANEGWIGWGDWLGRHTRWNHRSIVAFLRALAPAVQYLQPLELYLILQRNGMLRLDRRNANAAIVERIRGLCSARDAEVELGGIAGEIDVALADEAASESAEAPLDDATEPGVARRPEGGVGENASRNVGGARAAVVGVTEEDHADGFRWLRNRDALKVVDELVESRLVDDVDLVEDLVRNRVAGLWQKAISLDSEFDPELVRSDEGGVHFGQIADRFLKEYDRVKSLGLPSGYDFRRDGRLQEPNLMQRLIAHRLLTEKRVGNWSGVGAGKTISALYSAGLLDAGLTLVVAANATVAGGPGHVGDWERVVRDVYPDALVFTKKQASEIRVEQGRRTFVVMNYESFQQPWSERFVEDLTSTSSIDFIVLDEVQEVRRRREGKSGADRRGIVSDRRGAVQLLLDRASRRNPELRVLAMSATPVVNNLVEAKYLLEMLTGEDLSGLPTGTSVANAIEYHRRLVRHGVRYLPRYDQEIETTFPILDGSSSLPRLRGVEPGRVLQLEQATLDVKLAHLAGWLGERGRTRTMIYAHYVREIVDQVVAAVGKAGFSAGVYTGSRKDGLEAFLRKDAPVDVLVGSKPIGTGVDGLQHACNRLIFLSLPWSNAEYEQVVGRLWRHGSPFGKIQVIIPQVLLRRREAGHWSWDEERYMCIKRKKTLTDAVLDGAIPEKHLPSREELERRSIRALHQWIERVSKGDPTIELER
jgi:hypothetical protein